MRVSHVRNVRSFKIKLYDYWYWNENFLQNIMILVQDYFALPTCTDQIDVGSFVFHNVLEYTLAKCRCPCDLELVESCYIWKPGLSPFQLTEVYEELYRYSPNHITPKKERKVIVPIDERHLSCYPYRNMEKLRKDLEVEL